MRRYEEEIMKPYHVLQPRDQGTIRTWIIEAMGFVLVAVALYLVLIF